MALFVNILLQRALEYTQRLMIPKSESAFRQAQRLAERLKMGRILIVRFARSSSRKLPFRNRPYSVEKLRLKRGVCSDSM
jgi:hypothetical protein